MGIHYSELKRTSTETFLRLKFCVSWKLLNQGNDYYEPLKLNLLYESLPSCDVREEIIFVHTSSFYICYEPERIDKALLI